MEWTVHGERQVYSDPWVNLWLADVQQPDGHRFDHHVVRLRNLAVCAVLDAEQRVLLLWRHRFITDTWSWELPMGLIEPGETPAQAAVREAEEETGWRVGSLRPLLYTQLANGITDSEHHYFHGGDARWTGPPTEVNEADRVEWVPLADVRTMIDQRQIVSSASVTPLLYLLMDGGASPAAAPPAPHTADAVPAQPVTDR